MSDKHLIEDIKKLKDRWNDIGKENKLELAQNLLERTIAELEQEGPELESCAYLTHGERQALQKVLNASYRFILDNITNEARSEPEGEHCEQEEPERVCDFCNSSRGELVEDPPHGREVTYTHRYAIDCVNALNEDKASLQQENQRLQEQLEGGPMTPDAIAKQIFNISREERARELEQAGDKLREFGDRRAAHFLWKRARNIREGWE